MEKSNLLLPYMIDAYTYTYLTMRIRNETRSMRLNYIIELSSLISHALHLLKAAIQMTTKNLTHRPHHQHHQLAMCVSL